MQLPCISPPHLLRLDQFKSEIYVAVAVKLIQQWTHSAEMWLQLSLAKLECPLQRSLQNLRQSVVKEHAWSHLFTDAVKFVCLEIMKCFPLLDEKLKAWVQHPTVDNNQLATEFPFVIEFFVLCRKVQNYYCRVVTAGRLVTSTGLVVGIQQASRRIRTTVRVSYILFLWAAFPCCY